MPSCDGHQNRPPAKLLKAGLVSEIKAKSGMEIWRMIPMSSPAKLTDTQRAILFEASERKDRCLIAPKTLKGRAWYGLRAALIGRDGLQPCDGQFQRIRLACSREELIAATGWLPHTARAALTGLRHRGYDVRLERGETGRASVYRAVATLAASA